MKREKTMSKEEKEKELMKEYEKFIKTEKGKEWRNCWKTEIDSDSCGDDFGYYLYDFYPEMLQ